MNISFYHYPALNGAVRFHVKDSIFFLTNEGKNIVDPLVLKKIDSCFENGVLLKDTRSTTAALAAVSSDGAPVFLKRTNNKGLLFTLRYLFRCARVFRAAAAAQMLEKIGIRTPRVLLAGEKRSGLILRSGYLVTATAPEIHSVAYLIRETGAAEAVLDSFLPYAAKNIAALHAAKIEHGDLKVVNFYYTGQWTPNTEYGIWDLDSVRRRNCGVAPDRVAKELSRVVFSLHLLAVKNPCFSESICSPEYLSGRLTELYRNVAAAGQYVPDPEDVLRHAKARLEYLKIHPYKPSKTEMI